MSVVWFMSVVGLAIVLVLAARRRRASPRRTRDDRAGPTLDAVASRVGGHCLLCNRPLPSQLVTREEVIARVEARIDVDTEAVSQLLASPPSRAWVGLFRP